MASRLKRAGAEAVTVAGTEAATAAPLRAVTAAANAVPMAAARHVNAAVGAASAVALAVVAARFDVPQPYLASIPVSLGTAANPKGTRPSL